MTSRMVVRSLKGPLDDLYAVAQSMPRVLTVHSGDTFHGDDWIGVKRGRRACCAASSTHSFIAKR
jgi:hypothetical protein